MVGMERLERFCRECEAVAGEMATAIRPGHPLQEAIVPLLSRFRFPRPHFPILLVLQNHPVPRISTKLSFWGVQPLLTSESLPPPLPSPFSPANVYAHMLLMMSYEFGNTALTSAADTLIGSGGPPGPSPNLDQGTLARAQGWAQADCSFYLLYALSVADSDLDAARRRLLIPSSFVLTSMHFIARPLSFLPMQSSSLGVFVNEASPVDGTLHRFFVAAADVLLLALLLLSMSSFLRCLLRLLLIPPPPLNL